MSLPLPRNTITAGESFGHRLLWCRLVGITFPDSRTCCLHLHEGHCTDMSGAIKVAKSITKHLLEFNLRVVQTIAAGEPDTYYIRLDNGEWTAREVGAPRPRPKVEGNEK